jgi:hypothetical protein
MAEVKKENHIVLFERCVEWLDKNKVVHQVVQWLQTHLEVAVLLLAFVIALVLFAIGRNLFPGKPQPAMHSLPDSVLLAEVSARQELAKEMKSLAEQVARLTQQQTAQMMQTEQKIAGETEALRTRVSQLESQLLALQKQLEFFRQTVYLGKLPLQQLEVNGRQVSLMETRVVWIRDNSLKLARLKFVAGDNNDLVAQRNLQCRYTVNDGLEQRAAGIGDILVIPLPARESKFVLKFSEIRFQDTGQNELVGFAQFTVRLDTTLPKSQMYLHDDSLEIVVQEQESGVANLQLSDSAGQTWRSTPQEHGVFQWQKDGESWRIRIALKELGQLQKLQLTVSDVAGNVEEESFGRLTRVQLEKSVSAALSLPVVLKVSSPLPLGAGTQVCLHIEQFTGGEFRFFQEMTNGPLTLPEGLYRVQAFAKEGELRGPYSEPVVFRVDTTPPQGILRLSEKEADILWQIETTESGIEILTSVEWEGGFLALKMSGKAGHCEVPLPCQQATVRSLLRDEAGNETTLTQVWKRTEKKR